MAEFQKRYPLEGEVDLERLEDYYTTNGYTRREGDEVVFERGEQGLGWWTNDQTELQTEVRLEDDALRYTVDVTGQHVVEAEREFWAREAREAAAYATGAREEIVDLRTLAAQRAKRQKNKTYALGLVLGGCAFILVAGLKLLGFF